MKRIVFCMGAVVCAALVIVTWALTRISAWIVFHDTVWPKMDSEGAGIEHGIAEVFLVGRDLYLPAIEGFLGGLFLVLLGRLLFSNTERIRGS